ncbi:hypothetical protein BURKHO8Y_20066 [Burkholderia sp. 8Y]|nr:hypothetical protein BURKHO8Y_20066 [Burkholderia sp. 8Y]
MNRGRRTKARVGFEKLANELPLGSQIALFVPFNKEP